MIDCINCGVSTPIDIWIKYYRDSGDRIHLGGSELRGPICQGCYVKISDEAYNGNGKPALIQKEEEFIRAQNNQMKSK